MAVSATQATLLLQTYQDSLVQTRSAVLEARYTEVFAQITSRANLGLNSLTIPVVISQFQELRVYLIGLGYTVTLPQNDPAQNGALTASITWPTASPSAVTGISPTQIIALVGQAVDTLLVPTGGVAPYAFTANGTLPNGLVFGANTGVDALAITGTPTANAVTVLSITVTDSQGTAYTTTLGVSVGNADLTNIYTLPAATTSSLGGVKVDGVTIKVTDGIIALQASPFLTQQIRNGTIAIAAAMA